MEKLLFKRKTCPILMFSLLLQIEFLDTYRPSSATVKEQSLLLEFAVHTLQLMNNCTQMPAHWISRPCLCYAHLVCVIINQLYLCVKSWIDDPFCREFERIPELACSTVIFVHDHFVTNLDDIVLDTGDADVRQRLHTLFHWILRFKSLFSMMTSAHGECRLRK